jgi:hypothetical protein
MARSPGGVAELSGERGLAGTRGAADQDRAAAVGTAPAEHHIEPVDARGHAFLRDGMLEQQRVDWLNRNPMFADQERILVGPVQRASIFEDSQPPSR